jgi:hypothetical protein
LTGRSMRRVSRYRDSQASISVGVCRSPGLRSVKKAVRSSEPEPGEVKLQRGTGVKEARPREGVGPAKGGRLRSRRSVSVTKGLGDGCEGFGGSLFDQSRRESVDESQGGSETAEDGKGCRVCLRGRLRLIDQTPRLGKSSADLALGARIFQVSGRTTGELPSPKGPRDLCRREVFKTR